METYKCVVCGKLWSGHPGNIPLCPRESFWGNFDCIDKWDRTIEFEGVKLKVDDKAKIVPGDIYLAKRNAGWKLLTCDYVKMGAIFPVENAYPYDIHECYKVISE